MFGHMYCLTVDVEATSLNSVMSRGAGSGEAHPKEFSHKRSSAPRKFAPSFGKVI